MVSLLRTGVDMQTSMAMFRRVFDYLDLPVEIDEPAESRVMREPWRELPEVLPLSAAWAASLG